VDYGHHTIRIVLSIVLYDHTLEDNNPIVRSLQWASLCALSVYCTAKEKLIRPRNAAKRGHIDLSLILSLMM